MTKGLYDTDAIGAEHGDDDVAGTLFGYNGREGLELV